MTEQEQLNHAVLYALKMGCFFPVRPPATTAPIQQWNRWGALRYLHDAIKEFADAERTKGKG